MEFFVGSKSARFLAKNQHTYLDMISKIEVTKKISIKNVFQSKLELSDMATQFEKKHNSFHPCTITNIDVKK